MKIHHKPSLSPSHFHGFVAVSPQMRDFFDLARRVARTDASILIRGETGTGKELAAKALHDMSPRSHGPFRAINCAILSPELLISELFGHVKGSFTGAIRDRKGLFELADGGTIFLDEIAEMPLDIQARLLRVLQEQQFVPLGGSEPVRVNVRVLSATHRSLRRMVEKHSFRADLMYRIRVVPMFLPPLAERDGDVCALTWHFIEQLNLRPWRTITGIEDAALEALLSYSWPGNVRELRNAVEYAFAVGEGPTWRFEELPPELRGEAPEFMEDLNLRPAHTADASTSRSQPTSYEEGITALDIERAQLVEALQKAQGRRSEAADMLGISRTTLWRKLREHKMI